MNNNNNNPWLKVKKEINSMRYREYYFHQIVNAFSLIFGPRSEDDFSREV